MNIPSIPHFVHETITRWSDEDNQGVLNNAVYLTLFEEARLAFSRMAEVLDDERRFPFLLAETTVRFVKPGRGGERVTVELSTTEVGRSSFRQGYRVKDEGGVVWAEGEGVLVCYDPETMGSRPIPDDLREALGALG